MTEHNVTGKLGIERARFFLERLEEVESTEPFDRLAAAAYLEAAMVFGKNTVYVIRERTDKKNTLH